MTVTGGARSHLFGSSGKHARVVVATVTDKEWPVARAVFGACGELVELNTTGAFTLARYVDEEHLPFVLVRASDRGNTPVAVDVQQWAFAFRPTAFLLTGTAGGVWRPDNDERTVWSGAERGDVVYSGFVHDGDYRKVTARGTFRRHGRLEQPSSYLLEQARALNVEPASWHRWLGPHWRGRSTLPAASAVGILAGGQIQDDPLDAAQQWLMREFDRAGATEMESAGLASSLHRLRTDATYAPMYLSIRGISDLIWACDTREDLSAEDVERAREFDRLRHADEEQDGDKSTERDGWSPRAAEAASAFALGLVQRLVKNRVTRMPGHPPVPAFELAPVSGSGSVSAPSRSVES